MRSLTSLCFALVLAADFLTALPLISIPRSLNSLHKRKLGGTQITGCSLDAVQLPKKGTEPQVPDVSAGFKLKYAAVGRGTQNYTCSGSSEDAPKAVGAVAILYDVSCLAAYHSAFLHELVGGTLQFQRSYEILAASVLDRVSDERVVIGHHYFTDPTTPTFDFRMNSNTDYIEGKKSANVPAPQYATKGRDNQGNGAVDWLKLTKKKAAPGLEEVYRMITAGGNPPKTCAEQEKDFEVEYAAEYYFYG